MVIWNFLLIFVHLDISFLSLWYVNNKYSINISYHLATWVDCPKDICTESHCACVFILMCMLKVI